MSCSILKTTNSLWLSLIISLDTQPFFPDRDLQLRLIIIFNVLSKKSPIMCLVCPVFIYISSTKYVYLYWELSDVNTSKML